MEFIKNELINEVLRQYFTTFSLTLDTCEYVPNKYSKKVHKFIYKNMKQKFKEVNGTYRKEKKLRAKQKPIAPTIETKQEKPIPALITITENQMQIENTERLLIE